MPLAIAQIDTRQEGSAAQIAQLRKKLAPTGDVVSEAGRKKTVEVFGEPLSPAEVVERICSDVRTRGLEAVLDYTAKLDKVKLTADTLRVPAQELAAAHAKAGPDVSRNDPPHPREHPAVPNGDPAPGRADRNAARRLPAAALPAARAGRHLRARRRGRVSVDGADDGRAGPGGRRRARSPSSRRRRRSVRTTTTCSPLAMNSASPRSIASAVRRRSRRWRTASPDLAGGPLAKVDKIVGPGNLFVALAKKHVFGDVDIDSIAGPSEVIVIADETTPADFRRRRSDRPGRTRARFERPDHLEPVAVGVGGVGAGSATGDARTRRSGPRIARSVRLPDPGGRPRRSGPRSPTRWRPSTCTSPAPTPRNWPSKIRYAGAIFLGPYSPVALGDYVAGPSHVLPTGATARFASGLSSNDFLRSNSVIHFTPEGLNAVADDVVLMAKTEGLTAHAASVLKRQNHQG